MSIRQSLFLAATVLLTACGSDEQPATVSETVISEGDARPNILLIVADDLGYADLGVYGSEIPTPNLDMLAASGMLLTDFYTSLTCGPTRSMLMSGMDNHMAGVGTQGIDNYGNYYGEAGVPVDPAHQGQPNYLGYLSFRVASLAELMTAAGYNTYMTGKWHLGFEVEDGAHARGFKRNFVSLDGAAHLGGRDWRGPIPARYRDGDELVFVDDDWYTTRDYTRKMIGYIEEDRDQDKPFFGYLAYTAPHWPLQAPADVIEKFRGWYDEGYEATYLRRFERMKALGHIERDAEPVLDMFSPRWDALSEEEQAYSARTMEVYAAMVSELDTYVGEVVDYLKEIGEFDNTFIMFMSDNGAQAGDVNVLSPKFRESLATDAYDQSLDNMGSATSYIMYGTNWAAVSETGFRGHKALAFEGGIHAPAFVHHPSLVEGGARHDGFSTVMDVLPTFLALAGTIHPGNSFQGREVLPPMGKSILPMITGETSEVHEQEGYTGWELNGQRAIRQDDWKIVWNRVPGQDSHWMLFNLEDDPMEQMDLGTELPDKLADMVSLWESYKVDSGVINIYPE